ncbi:MAG: glycosyltransferase [Chitinophagaceae bacterium]|nr:glycosyltransferase [Chitinophagaceae bacterium]
MKILWLCSWYPHSTDRYDGDFIERHAKALSEFQKVDVIHIVQNTSLLTNETYRTEKHTEKNLQTQIVYVPVPNTPFATLTTALFNRRYYRQMLDTLKEYSEQNGVPDLVHVHVPVKMGAAALWLKRKFSVPFVVTEHSNIYHNRAEEESFSTYSPYFRFITKRVIDKADVLITVSDFLGKAINEIAGKKEYTVIPNVVDTSRFYYTENKPAHSVFRFLHVSNLYPVKNPQLMLEVIHLFLQTDQSAEFIFIGNKTKEWELKAAKLGIPKKSIQFMGEIPYAKVAEELKKADALFLYSKSETFSCVTAEALCCGLPVVSSNVGAIPELVNKTNGILAEPENAEALANAMLLLKKKYGQFNRKKIAEEASAKYNYSIVAQQLLSVYQKVLGKY